MGIKRCPSFSKRPGFPCGLRVLLLDASEAQRQDCEQRLKECAYEVGLLVGLQLAAGCQQQTTQHAALTWPWRDSRVVPIKLFHQTAC
jgi:hypothetical protein